MIHSMTGYARRERQGPGGELSWELRSVNHRFLEISLHLPEGLVALEGDIRRRMGRILGRGRVDAWLRHRPAAGERLRLDMNLASELCGLYGELADVWEPEERRLDLMEVLRWPGLVQTGSGMDADSFRADALDLLDETLQGLQETRAREGEELAAVLVEKVAAIREHVTRIRAWLPETGEALRERLQARLEEIGQQVDSGRWEQELVYYLHRQDISEELDRLETHAKEILRVLQRREPVGRRLDFLVQECNREANTLGSKAGDQQTSTAAVELKVLIEQMREQIQNVE